MNTIFGPVNSRRFGVSLGIDLSPFIKQCNYDCLYCELTPSKTVDKQKQIVEVEEIIKELHSSLKKNIDVITITANGEPTLYPKLNILIDEIDKLKNKTQTLILTNSANIVKPDIFNTLLKFDQVKLSLDAVSENIFNKIDRPHKDIYIDDVLGKIREFSKIYKGKLFIEILFVSGLNDKDEEIRKLSDFLLGISCLRVDITSIDRPPAYPIKGLNYTQMHKISLKFDSSIAIHIATRNKQDIKYSSYSNETILNTLDKRPLTYQDIDLLFDEDSKKRLNILIENGKITKKIVSNIEFLIPSA